MPAKKGLYRIPEGMTATPSQAGKKTPSQAGRKKHRLRQLKRLLLKSKENPRHSFAASNIHIFSKKSILLIFNDPISLHFRKLIAHGTAVHIQIIS